MTTHRNPLDGCPDLEAVDLANDKALELVNYSAVLAANSVTGNDDLAEIHANKYLN